MRANWTSVCKQARFFVGEYTTAHDENGFVPARTCGHLHKTAEAAERCSSRHYPWIVYRNLEGTIKRSEEVRS